MIYKKMTSDIAGIFERQESTSKWHKCMLLNVSNPVAEYSTKNNATMPLQKECTPLPEVRVLHSLSLGTETLISTEDICCCWLGACLFQHILGRTGIWVHRSGLTWESDKEEQRKHHGRITENAREENCRIYMYKHKVYDRGLKSNQNQRIFIPKRVFFYKRRNLF